MGFIVGVLKFFLYTLDCFSIGDLPVGGEPE
jgi:hypothetical protein